ncbi:MAG TPA: hypothetical protein VI172_12785 [Candidatus Dormibacteraeota bacterium]
MSDTDDQYAEAFGDPGAAADLPVTTGRDVVTGEPDRPLEEQ